MTNKVSKSNTDLKGIKNLYPPTDLVIALNRYTEQTCCSFATPCSPLTV